MAGDAGAAPEQWLGRAGVTEREAEVLSALAGRLRNREIASRLHISVRTVESHIAALMRKLGVTDRMALAEIAGRLPRVSRAAATIPSPLTSLVGRDGETGEVVALLAAHRLVTLTGPAGVGKTRLALRVAAAGGDTFADGIRFTDLAPVGPDLVGDTLARALGVVPQQGWPLRDILREVASALHCLLLVDNCEHVVGQVAEIVADLLAAGSRLRVLATSREPLGIPGEATYQVRTLSVPALHNATSAAAGGFDAVRLFVDRAAAVSPGFALTDAIAPAVTALCRRLDGLPLAIELAASRMRSFDPAGLVEHLDQRFELLSGGARTALPRHRTLRAAIDWSYDLLDHDERALFDRIGVFPADFDYAAVRAICGTGDPGDRDVLALLPGLVDKSLVFAVGGGRRYRLLETIRAYAAERLAASGAEADARRQHAAYYLALADEANAQLRTPDQRAWIDLLILEQPNLRAAQAHSIGAGDIDAAWRWVDILGRFWDINGQRREGHEWIQRALDIGDPPATPGAACGLAAASLILQPTDARAAFGLAQRAARLAAGLDDVTRAKAALAVGMGAAWVQPELAEPALRQALAWFGAGHPWDRALTMQSLAITGKTAEALDWAREGVALFRRIGDHLYMANSLFILAQRSLYAGIADDEVHEWLTESQALAEAAGSEGDRIHATVGFAQLAWLSGDHDRAATLMEECLPALRRLGDQRCLGRALHLLGQRAREQRELARAEELLAGSIDMITIAGQSIILVSAVEALADVLAAQGRPWQAAMLLGAAYAARESATAHMRPIQAPDDELRRSLAQALGTAAFEAAYREGEGLAPAQALQRASSARVDGLGSAAGGQGGAEEVDQ